MIAAAPISPATATPSNPAPVTDDGRSASLDLPPGREVLVPVEVPVPELSRLVLDDVTGVESDKGDWDDINWAEDFGLAPEFIDDSMSGLPDDSEISNMEDDIPVAFEPEPEELGVANNIVSKNESLILIHRKYVRTTKPAPLQVSAKEDKAALISPPLHTLWMDDWTALAFLQMLLRSAGFGWVLFENYQHIRPSIHRKSS